MLQKTNPGLPYFMTGFSGQRVISWGPSDQEVKFTLNADGDRAYWFEGGGAPFKCLSEKTQMRVYREALEATCKKFKLIVSLVCYEYSENHRLHCHGILEYSAPIVKDSQVIRVGQYLSSLIGRKGLRWYVAACLDCMDDKDVWIAYCKKGDRYSVRYEKMRYSDGQEADYGTVIWKKEKVVRKKDPVKLTLEERLSVNDF